MAVDLHIGDRVRVDDASSNDAGRAGMIWTVSQNGPGGKTFGVMFPNDFYIRYFSADALTPVEATEPLDAPKPREAQETEPPNVTLQAFEDGTATLTVDGGASLLANLAVAIIGGYRG